MTAHKALSKVLAVPKQAALKATDGTNPCLATVALPCLRVV